VVVSLFNIIRIANDGVGPVRNIIKINLDQLVSSRQRAAKHGPDKMSFAACAPERHGNFNFREGTKKMPEVRRTILM
jgi:hypothetical protein